MLWDTAFEGTPGGSDFGSVTGIMIRNAKLLFRTMLEKEHLFSTDEIPVMSHKVGYCSILGFNEIPSKEGCISLVSNKLYHYDGISDIEMGGNSHASLDGLTEEDTHLQYVEKTVSEFGDWSLTDIVNTMTYSDVSMNDNDIISRASHKNLRPDGSVNHNDECITNNSIIDKVTGFSLELLNFTDTLLGSGVSSINIPGANTSIFTFPFKCTTLDGEEFVYLKPHGVFASNGSSVGPTIALSIIAEGEGDISSLVLEEYGE